MAKPPFTGSADSRPRLYFRVRGEQAQVARTDRGPWTDVDDVIAAIDEIAGEDAWREAAVIFWQGVVLDA